MEDSVIHIVKRTDQWNERAMFNYLVPRGVFCVELTPDNKTKLKVGEGNKYYRQLPYIGNDIDISDYFTKEEVEKLVKDKSEETVIKYMDKQPYMRVIGPPLPSPSALPKSGNKEGDVRFVKLAKVQEGNAYTEYVWFEGRWEPISAALDIDLSKYATKEELAAVQKTATELARRLTLVEQAKHVHMNKGVLDLITAPFTTELASKLSGIEPNANRYVLPIATRHSLGGIIIGDGLLIDSNGRVTIDTSGIIIPPYDDTELRQRIGTLERSSHQHSNKTILDNTTASYTISEKEKLAGLQNYDDTEIREDISDLQSQAHTHSNKSILDQTTAPYTTEEQTKLAGLENYTLPVASANTLGGVKVGDGLSIDQDGILSADESIVYRAGAGISIETTSGGDPSIYDTTHPYYSDTQTSAILDCPGRRRTYTRTTTNPAYVVISRVKNTSGSPYYWYTVYVISKNINDTLCNFLDSDHFSGRSSTADAVSVTIDGTTWYGNGYMISLGDINPVGDVNEVVPYFESEETSATDTVAAILDYIYSDDTSKYIVNTGVLDVTKNASGNLVVSKESGDTTITLPQEYTLPIASANDLGGVIIGDGISIDENGVISASGGEYIAGDGISIVNGGQIVTDLSGANWGNYADMYDGQRSPTYDSKTFKLRYLHIEPGTQFKIKLTPADPNDTIYWYLYGYENDAATTGGLHFGQSSDPNDWDTDCDYVYTMPAGKSSLDITVRINNTQYGYGDAVTLSKFDEMQYITGTGPTTKTINVTPATTQAIGGVIIGTGLSIDQDGVLSADGSSGKEYDAGDGIRIDQGSGGGGDGFITTDPSYIDDTNVCMTVGSRTFRKLTTDPAYGFAYTNQNDSWNGPLFISTIEAGVQHQCSGFSDIMSWFSFDYMDKTWYVSPPSYWDTATCSTTLPDIDFTGYNVNSQSDVETVFKAKLDEIYANPPLVNDTINVIPATTQTIGGVIIGNGINVDQNGVISVDTPTEYVAGDGISFEELHSDYDSSSPYYFTGTTMCTINGREYWRPDSSAGHPCYAWISRSTDGNVGPIVVSKNQDDVTVYWTGSTQQWLSTVTYNGETWYVSKNAWWYDGNVTSTDIYWPFESGGSEDVTTAVLQVLSQMHPDQSTGTMITNTGVLDVTKDNNGDLVVSKTTGDATLQLDHYTLPTASDTTLGGIKVGSNLSIDANGVLSATGGGSGGGGGNLVNGVATTVSSKNVDTDMHTDVQWDQGSIAQNGDLARNDRIRTHDYFPITIPSDGKITFIAHDTNDVGLTWNIMLYTADQQLLLDSPWTPYGSELNLLEYIDTGKLARYVLCYPDNDPIEPSNLKDAVLRMTNTAVDVNYSSGLIVNQDNELEVSPATTTDIGGVKVGSGLSITSDGTLTANAGIEYVAGDGISIEQGSTESTDITDLQWEQGSINPVNGEPDDFTMTVIRSPMIEVGLTNMLNVSAQDTSDNDMRWEAAFYDSNSEFISMTSTWQTLSDEVIRPDNAKYVIILLRKDAETEIDENALKACEISWPIEIGKYVITNTGVTHIGLDENGSIIGVENGSTNTILEFSQDLDVTNGVVSIPDYHRLILNVEN